MPCSPSAADPLPFFGSLLPRFAMLLAGAWRSSFVRASVVAFFVTFPYPCILLNLC